MYYDQQDEEEIEPFNLERYLVVSVGSGRGHRDKLHYVEFDSRIVKHHNLHSKV